MLFVTVTCLLGLVAQVSDQSHLQPVRYYFERPEIDQEDGSDTQLEGQSRALGGSNMRHMVDSFPWFNILFRNPAATLNDYARPLDGYTTGYAIEVAHHVFLGHKKAIQRASHMHGKTLAMQGWRRLDKTYLNPFRDFVWGEPKDGTYQGVVRLLADVGPSLGLYHIRREKYPFVERAAAAAARSEPRLDSDGLPPFDYPEGKGAYAYEYPRLNKDKNLKDNCFMYAMAGPYVIGGQYDGRANRTFVKWPVKLIHCEQDDCLLAYDEARAPSATLDLKLRGWQCDTWQDVGAPIMCGERAGSQLLTTYYQRRYLMLSYVVLPTRPYDTRKAGCYLRVNALRIADHADKIEQIIDKMRKSGSL